MSVDCSAVIGWGYIPNEDDEKILRKNLAILALLQKNLKKIGKNIPLKLVVQIIIKVDLLIIIFLD